MASLNIKSLLTNVPVKRCLNLLKTHLIKTKIKLLLTTHKIIKHVPINIFHLRYKFDRQHFLFYRCDGLACLFLEFWESGPFKKKITTKFFLFWRHR